MYRKEIILPSVLRQVIKRDETDVEHFNNGALRIITNIVKKEYIFHAKLKNEFFHRYSSKILFIAQNSFLICEILH